MVLSGVTAAYEDSGNNIKNRNNKERFIS